LLDDGLRQYAWDAENRLIAVEVKTNMGLPRIRSEYTYDAQGRRVRAMDYVWDTNSIDFVATNTRQFIYDDWNLVAERGNGYTNFMAWGLDLSGTLQGAGGVGGLLARASVTSSSTSTILYAYDGNGNVTDLVDENGDVVGHYDYDPFGNIVSQSGAMAQSNPFRFSTKYFEAQWNLYYYGYRYYSPGLTRWLSRDPIGERGSTDLYAFVYNRPILLIDVLGERGNDVPPVDIQLPPSNGPILSKSTIEGPIIGKCGFFSWTIKWNLNRYPLNGGIIVQGVNMTIDVKNCKGQPKHYEHHNFWEGWIVDSGGNVSPLNMDTFSGLLVWPCSKGTISISGMPEFYPSQRIPSGWQQYYTKRIAGPPGILPHGYQDPNLPGGTGPITHYAFATWDCCPEMSDTQLITR